MLCKCEDLCRSLRSCLKPSVLMHRLQPQHWGMWTLLELDKDTIHPPWTLYTQLPGYTYTAHVYHTHKSKKCFSVVIIAHPDKNVEKLVSKYITGGRVKWYSYSEKQICQFISLSLTFCSCLPVFVSLTHKDTHTHYYIPRSHISDHLFISQNKKAYVYI